jgi:DNA-binding Lrp family transcriptional regulator
MSICFVLIDTEPGRERAVFATLLKVAEISELHHLLGEYDLIAKVEASDLDAVGEVIISKVRSVSGVVDTRTLATATL